MRSVPSTGPPVHAAGRTVKAEVSDAQVMDQAARQLCHPDVDRPFSSIADAVQRLLPYHVR
jgi:uncharacterized protein YceK